MRSFGILLSILGIFLTAGAVAMYFSEIEGAGIACMVLGGGLFLTGVMIFMGDLALRLTRRSGKAIMHFEFKRLKLDVRAELESSEGEAELSGLDHWLDKSLSEIGIS
jgi:hypothetical protein